MDQFEEHGIGVVTGRDASARALRSPDLTSDPGGGSPSVLLRDGEGHTRLRGVLREIIAGLEPLPAPVLAGIEAVVAGLGPAFDLVRDFARPVAGAVTSAVLGIPLDDAFLDRLEATTANLDVFGGTDRAGQAAAFRLAVQLSRTPAGPGGLTALREAHADGRLDEDELTFTPVVLAHAAYENSLNFLACAGLALATSGPRSVRELVTEICPARYVLRFGADGPVAVSLADGLPFGLGRHACPGSGVALAEGEVALGALAKVLAPGCDVTDVAWKTHPVFHGLASARVVVSGQAG
ncbi:cytochrome P450 [Amycolatopsis sp. FBCC-B4732]|uniref:cytochrome P450 n=1 Tax=Amycolatopsis sp. FBCC-B4732 TaxID=3079339 RepID=UPI001FF1EA82|nr:cytochrome P450 [Amycolatopsis sp. FBCC-B4732]UOX86569.1 cytochrome P450 [Amycolatopsis sp. FBCC-B4732]